MSTVELRDQAISLLEAGRKAEAGRILADLVKQNPEDEFSWRWLSRCVASEEQKRYCLNQVLRINPQNEDAKSLLADLDFEPVFEQPASPKEKVVSRRSPQEKLCPLCHSPMPVNAHLCPHCGKNASTEQAKAIGWLSCSLIQLVFWIPVAVVSIWCMWIFLTAK